MCTPAESSRQAGISPNIIERLGTLLTRGSAIVCVGNELLGDDAAGVLVGRRLAPAEPWNVYNVQTAPENFLFLIADRKPPAVLIIDAMDFGGEPGAVTIIDGDRVTGQGPGTHGPTPEGFLELLAQVHPCPTMVLGLQPSQTAMGAPLSAAVAAAVDDVAAILLALADKASP